MKVSLPTIPLATLMGAIAVAFAGTACATDTTLAATPQMGFNNWNSTQCRAEFDEKMIRGIADKFISLGLRDAGYRYVNIDDCWANWKRDKNGKLQANPQRFPSGIRALADYIHGRGLKFGVYSSAGTSTCEPLKKNRGFPGGLGHEKDDAAIDRVVARRLPQVRQLQQRQDRRKETLHRHGRSPARYRPADLLQPVRMGRKQALAVGRQSRRSMRSRGAPPATSRTTTPRW